MSNARITCSGTAALAALIVGCFAATSATATPITFLHETFDEPWDDAPWRTNAFLDDPAAFEAVHFDGDYRLRHQIDGAGGFFQGFERDTQLPAWRVQTLSVDLYVDEDWGDQPREAYLWAHMVDTDGQLSGFPNMLFMNESADLPASFYIFDDHTGDFIPILEVEEFGLWYNLEMRMTWDEGFEYLVDGEVVATQEDGLPFNYHLPYVELYGANFGGDDDYDIYWDNVVATAVPAPAAAVAGLAAFGLMGLSARRPTRRSRA